MHLTTTLPPSPKPRRGGRWISKARRLALYVRDGFACVYCGADLLDVAPAARTLDHVHARRNGGSNANENLLTACRPCNCSKQARALETWRPEAVAAALEALERPVDVAAARRALLAAQA